MNSDIMNSEDAAQRLKLAQAGLFHAIHLEEILDALGIYVVDLDPVLSALKEEL